jgi:hypothetical protein
MNVVDDHLVIAEFFLKVDRHTWRLGRLGDYINNLPESRQSPSVTFFADTPA